MNWLFTSGSQNIGASASASVLPMNIQDQFSLGLTGLIFLQSKGLSSLLQHHSSKASEHDSLKKKKRGIFSLFIEYITLQSLTVDKKRNRMFPVMAQLTSLGTILISIFVCLFSLGPTFIVWNNLS